MDEKERLVDLHYARVQAVWRDHRNYLALLLALLGFVWASYLGRPAGASANLFGMPIVDKILLGVTPGLSTILLLGLVGSFHATQPALELFKQAWSNAGGATELDIELIKGHESWVDYLGFIWKRPVGHLVRGATLLLVVGSTLAFGLILTPKFKGYSAFLIASYCIFCLAVQAAASWKCLKETMRTYWRKV